MKPKVIILEDDEGLRDLMTEILEDENVETHGFNDGMSALEHLKHESMPQVVIIDLKLPDMDPMAFRDNFSRLPGSDQASFIVASGSAQIEEWAQKLNAVTYLKKPYDIDIFTMTVMSVIDSKNLTNSSLS